MASKSNQNSNGATGHSISTGSNGNPGNAEVQPIQAPPTLSTSQQAQSSILQTDLPVLPSASSPATPTNGSDYGTAFESFPYSLDGICPRHQSTIIRSSRLASGRLASGRLASGQRNGRGGMSPMARFLAEGPEERSAIFRLNGEICPPHECDCRDLPEFTNLVRTRGYSRASLPVRSSASLTRTKPAGVRKKQEAKRLL